MYAASLFVLTCAPCPLPWGQVVVSKPASIPVHPCGAYKFNSLVTWVLYGCAVALGVCGDDV